MQVYFVLGPLLFLIYISGVSEVEHHNGSVVYANDTLLHHKIRSQADYLATPSTGH